MPALLSWTNVTVDAYLAITNVLAHFAARVLRRLAFTTVAGLVTLAVVAPDPAGATCEMCKFRLTTRTGPYKIIASKDVAYKHDGSPHIRVQIINESLHPIVVGGGGRHEVVLNAVTPQARGTEVVRIGSGSETVAPKSSVRFEAVYPYRLGRRGTYTFNVSYGGVDSNIVTYVI
ncbi:MAG: hypothetical protein JO083_09575 [Candidatus Eremiobacteraeota bacterium]|nr:hypothetical protein [Candidatus Eremiobacteraeota bacterium]